MHIVFASSNPWPLADAFADGGGHRVTRIVAPSGELPARLGSMLPDVVVLDYDEQELRQSIAEITRTARRAAIVPFCPAPSPDLLVFLMRLGISDMLMEEESDALERILARIQGSARTKGPDDRLKRAKRIAFLAAKGGNGTTFLLSNFATALARETSGQVLLVDLSIPFGDIDIYLTPAKSEHDLVDFVQQIDRFDRSLLDAMVHHISDKLDLIPSPSTMDRVVRINPADVVKLIDKVDEYYDYVLFDLGTSVDQVGLPIVENVDQLVIVSRLDLPSARRTGQTIRLLADLDFPPAKLVVVSNEFGARTAITASEFEKAVGHSIQHRMPDAGPTLAAALAQSEPAIDLAPKSPFAKAIDKWVAELSGSSRKGRKLWGIFGTN